MRWRAGQLGGLPSCSLMFLNFHKKTDAQSLLQDLLLGHGDVLSPFLPILEYTLLPFDLLEQSRSDVLEHVVLLVLLVIDEFERFAEHVLLHVAGHVDDLVRVVLRGMHADFVISQSKHILINIRIIFLHLLALKFLLQIGLFAIGLKLIHHDRSQLPQSILLFLKRIFIPIDFQSLNCACSCLLLITILILLLRN